MKNITNIGIYFLFISEPNSTDHDFMSQYIQGIERSNSLYSKAREKIELI